MSEGTRMLEVEQPSDEPSESLSWRRTWLLAVIRPSVATSQADCI